MAIRGLLTMIQGTRADVILHAHELWCIFTQSQLMRWRRSVSPRAIGGGCVSKAKSGEGRRRLRGGEVTLILNICHLKISLSWSRDKRAGQCTFSQLWWKEAVIKQGFVMPADEIHRCWWRECFRYSGCTGAESGCLVMKWNEARSVVRTPTCFLRYNVRLAEREREGDREGWGGANVRSPLLLGARGKTDHMDSKVPFFNGASIWARADSPGDRRIHQRRARERGITSPVPSICRNWAGTGVGPCVSVRRSEEGESGPGVFLPPRSSQLHA